MTHIVSDIPSWHAYKSQIKSKTLGFVPTMGNLHAGHFSLVKRSQLENDLTAVSIFINPTQFNDPQDYLKYPRTLEQDIAELKKMHVDYIFIPDAKIMYPNEDAFRIEETHIATILEGKFRPGHFSGMMTIVMKLLNLMQAQRAYFGEKDFQQLLLVKKMTELFFMPVDIIACSTMRDENGLALSSRNSRLGEPSKIIAPSLFQHLRKNISLLEIKNQLTKIGFRVEYIEEHWGRRLAAAWLDDVRLIDNISLAEIGV